MLQKQGRKLKKIWVQEYKNSGAVQVVRKRKFKVEV